MIPERGSLFLCDSSKIEEKHNDIRVQDKWRLSNLLNFLSFESHKTEQTEEEM